MLLYKYFAGKYKLWPLSSSLSSSANVAVNGEITKLMDLEKEETMKNCSLAWPEHPSHRVLLLSAIPKAITPCVGELWLVSCSQPLFLQTTHLRHAKSVHSTGKGAGYTRLRCGHTRLEEPQLKEVNMQSIPCCKD